MEQPRGLQFRPHGSPRRRIPAQLHEGEGERLVHLVGAGVAGGAGRFQIDLAHQQAVRLVLLGEGAPAPVHLVDVLLVRDQRVGPQPVHHGGGGRCVRQAVRLEEGMRDVDPEAVHALVEPEAEHAFEVVAHGRVPPVPVGLAGGEEVQVPLGVRLGFRGSAAPGPAAEHALPVVRRKVGNEPGPELRPSTKWNMSRSGEPGPAAKAAWNSGWAEEQWLGTTSSRIRRPSEWASSKRESNSSMVPNSGSTPQ